ncbi:MAG: phage repressor [Rhodospirillaceae bacterium]|nr:MAG: phage repressor [Rhodospirillaceae bacterium]
MHWIQKRIKELKAHGRSQVGLAAALGVDPPRVTEIIKNKRKVKSTEVGILAEYLEMSQSQVLDLINRVEIESLPDDELIRRFNSTVLPRLTENRPEIPVWESVYSKEDGTFILNTTVIDWTRRSERMQDVRNPFAFYFVGRNMSPAIEYGDLLVVNTSVPVRTPSDCVFLNQQTERRFTALVRRLVQVEPEAWRVRRFDQSEEATISKSDWPKAFAITEIRRAGY